MQGERFLWRPDYHVEKNCIHVCSTGRREFCDGPKSRSYDHARNATGADRDTSSAERYTAGADCHTTGCGPSAAVPDGDSACTDSHATGADGNAAGTVCDATGSDRDAECAAADGNFSGSGAGVEFYGAGNAWQQHVALDGESEHDEHAGNDTERVALREPSGSDTWKRIERSGDGKPGDESGSSKFRHAEFRNSEFSGTPCPPASSPSGANGTTPPGK